MKLSELYWHRITPLHVLLWPLSVAYGCYLTIKKLCYWLDIFPSVKLTVPVIVIDSISIDDGGKTPFINWLIDSLLKNGYHPGIITRGNYDNPGSPAAVTSTTNPNMVGGKIFMLAHHYQQTCPVWVGRDRIAVAQALLNAHPACNIILCNDGMQFYRLERDVEIAIVDFNEHNLGNGLLLPAGPLRTPLRHLNKIELIVTSGKQDHHIDISKWTRAYNMMLANEIVYNVLNPEIRRPIKDFINDRIHAMASGENAYWFFDLIQKSGLNAQFQSFSENHQFHVKDFQTADTEIIIMPEENALQCYPFAQPTLWALPRKAWVNDELQAAIMKKLDKLTSKTQI